MKEVYDNKGSSNGIGAIWSKESDEHRAHQSNKVREITRHGNHAREIYKIGTINNRPRNHLDRPHHLINQGKFEHHLLVLTSIL